MKIRKLDFYELKIKSFFTNSFHEFFIAFKTPSHEFFVVRLPLSEATVAELEHCRKRGHTEHNR